MLLRKEEMCDMTLCVPHEFAKTYQEQCAALEHTPNSTCTHCAPYHPANSLCLAKTWEKFRLFTVMRMAPIASNKISELMSSGNLVKN